MPSTLTGTRADNCASRLLLHRCWQQFSKFYSLFPFLAYAQLLTYGILSQFWWPSLSNFPTFANIFVKMGYRHQSECMLQHGLGFCWSRIDYAIGPLWFTYILSLFLARQEMTSPWAALSSNVIGLYCTGNRRAIGLRLSLLLLGLL